MTVLKVYLLMVLLFANIQWSVSQDDGEGNESTAAVASTEDPDMISSTEEDSGEMTSTQNDSGSGSESDEGDEDSESEEGSSSSAMSSTVDSGSQSDDSSSATESSEDDESSSDDTESSESSEVEVDESAEDDNDSEDDEEGEEGGDDGSALESEEDDQDTDDESTEGPEEVEEDETADDGVDVNGDDAEDECVGLDANECGNTFADDGAQLCGFNTMTNNCYEVVMTAGTRGRGNFDDGYEAAQAMADEQAAELYTAIGVLGGIMAVLVLTVAAGAYYIHSNRKDADYKHTAVPMDIIDVDGGRTRTKGQHTRLESHSVHHMTDSTPMLDTM